MVKTILKLQDKLYFKKEKKKKKKNDVVADMAQCESNSIKRYASAFSNIQIIGLKIIKTILKLQDKLYFKKEKKKKE